MVDQKTVKGVTKLVMQVRDGLNLPFSNSDIHTIMAEVTANREVLDACPRHNFQAVDPDNVLSKRVCTNCGGNVDIREASWYERGLEHGKRGE